MSLELNAQQTQDLIERLLVSISATAVFYVGSSPRQHDSFGSPQPALSNRPRTPPSHGREERSDGQDHRRRSGNADRSGQVDSIRFLTVRSPHRLPEILELRRASGSSGDSTATDAPMDLEDPRDRPALFVIAEVGRRIVGSVRLVRPIEGPILHHRAVISGSMDGVPPRDQYLEASRACIHPDFRGQGLFWRLTAEMLKAARAFGRPYLIGGVEDRLWPFWRRCGFKKSGATYRKAQDATRYSVVVLTLGEVLIGLDIAPELASEL